MKISDQILKKIKKSGLTPKPKWYFEVMNIGWWIVFAILMLIGSIAFGVAIYMFTGSDWEIARRTVDSIGEQLLLALPLFWIVLIVVVGIIASWELRQTKRGYRYGIIPVLILMIIGSALLGTIVYASGFGEKLDTLFADNISAYRGRLHQQMQLWDREERGLFVGVVLNVNGKELTIMRPQHKEWLVDVSKIDDVELEELYKDQIIRIIGEVDDNDIIAAEQIRPLGMRHFEGMDGNMRSHKMYFERKY